MNCWMFPGQPLRHDQPFPETAHGQEIVSLCAVATGFDPSVWQDDGRVESENIRLQIYGTAASLCRARVLRTSGHEPDLVLEHSMGIYAALAACGCISERDALELTARVGNTLIRMSEKNRYALGCIIGLGVVPVESAASNNSVYVANYNTSSHFLLAGERSGIISAMEECAAAGAFSLSVFDCDAPLHTPLLTEIGADLEAVFSDYSYVGPKIPLLEHIGQQQLTAPQIAAFLLDELIEPVWWQRSYAAARKLGATSFVEVGSGEALKKFNRWIDSENRS